MTKEEVAVPKSVIEGIKRAKEKQRIREKIRFEKSVAEMYQGRRKLPKGIYLPEPVRDDCDEAGER